MSSNIAQVALALASLHFSKKELRETLIQLRNVHLDEFVSHIDSLRATSEAWASNPIEGALDVVENVRQPEYSTVGYRVARLLRIEARLPATVAAEKLTASLVDANLVATGTIPPLRKQSFQTWVDRTAEIVPAKEILRAATLLRNLYVHDPGPDWALKQDGR